MTFAVMRAAQISLLDTSVNAVPWSTAKVNLYKVAKVPSPNDVIGDYTLADYTGFGAVSVAWNNPYLAGNGNVVVDAPSIQFQPTDGVTPNTIYGYVITNAAGTVLLAAGSFASPVPLVDQTYALSIYPALSLPRPLDPNAAQQGGP